MRNSKLELFCCGCDKFITSDVVLTAPSAIPNVDVIIARMFVMCRPAIAP